MRNIDAFIQVRRSSTRVPDKAFAPLGEMSCIAHVITRLQRCSMIRKVVVCTSDLPEDRELVTEAHRLGVDAFQGDLSNCLERFALCANRFDSEIIVRVCGDSPLVCPTLVDQGIGQFLDLGCDYLDATELPVGTYFEPFTVQALERACLAAVDPTESADLTFFIGRSEINSVGHFDPPLEFRRKDLMLALNRPQDLRVIRRVFEEAPRSKDWLTLQDAIAYLDSVPMLKAENMDYTPVTTREGIVLDPSRLEPPA